MNLSAIILTAKKLKASADGVFALISLIAVPVMTVAPIVWYFEGPGSIHTRTAAYKAQAGTSAHISPELEFSTKPLRVAYQMKLIDRAGQVAFTYPLSVTKGVPQLDNMLVQVPSHLQPGDYSLVADVKYAINPIKSEDRTVQVASITVD